MADMLSPKMMDHFYLRFLNHWEALFKYMKVRHSPILQKINFESNYGTRSCNVDSIADFDVHVLLYVALKKMPVNKQCSS